MSAAAPGCLDGSRRAHAVSLLSLALLLGPIAMALQGCGGDEGVFIDPDVPTTWEERDDQNLLTVMSFNTYMLRINVVIEADVASNIDVRGGKIATWFKTLRPEEMPDVLVFQEIYSVEAQEMMQTLCNPIWTKNEGVLGGHNHAPYIRCTASDSPFEYATRVLNPRSATTVVKTGGVVVLVKKGIHMTSSDDQEFPDCAGSECFTAIGFWAVTIQKGTQKYWVFGLHAIAWFENAELRQKQYAQMRRYIDENVEDGARLVMAGDMNVATGPYVATHDGVDQVFVPNEFEPMLQTLGYSGNPATVGELQANGFWLPLEQPMDATWDPRYSHVVAATKSRRDEGLQSYDWVIAPGSGDRLATPVSMRYQVVPVKSDECFVTTESSYPEGTKTDDLSDHYGVFAELLWTNDTEWSGVVVRGHLGANGTIPSGPFCVD